MRCHPFEGEEIARLELLPLEVRRRLDVVGLHVSRTGWQALPLAEREAWCEADVDTAEGRISFARRVEVACRAVAHPATAIEGTEPGRPWNRPDAVPRVLERARILGMIADPAPWARLDEPARYALHRLSASEKSPDKLRAALVHFGLARLERKERESA